MLNHSIQEQNNNNNNINLKSIKPVQEAIDSIKERAYEDGLNKRETNLNGIKSSIRLIAQETRQLITAKLNFLKEKVSRIEQKINATVKEQELLTPEIADQQKTVKLFSGIIYSIAGMFFVFGDIEFSRQTLIKAWGLGNDSLFAQLSLVLGLAFTTFVVKIVYERIIEPYYNINKRKQDSNFTSLYILVGLISTGIFVYLGYVRSVYHEASLRTDIVGDIYDFIFNNHPHMDAIAFGGIAFIFLIGGAVTLTIGFKEIKNYWNYRRNLKKEKSLKRKQNGLEMYYDKISKRYHEVKEKNSFFENKEDFELYVEDQNMFYSDLYKSSYTKGKNEALKNKIDNENKQINDLSKKNFHDLVRVMLDKRMINNNNMQEVLNHA